MTSPTTSLHKVPRLTTFPCSLSIKTLLTKNHFQFPENREISLRLDKWLGEGSYGYVFQTHDQYAVKIFKNSVCGATSLTECEEHIFPEDHENRELLFYIQLLQRNPELYSCSIHHVLQPYAIGVTSELLSLPDISISISSYTYFVILPLCTPFYDAIPVRNLPLLQEAVDSSFGIPFVLHVMQKLCIASKYMEEEFYLYHLDLKINNIMFLKPMIMDGEGRTKPVPLEELIVIDFGLVKHAHTEEERNQTFGYNASIHYFPWPFSRTTIIQNVPVYSICMNGLELLFGKKAIEKCPSYKISKRILTDLANHDRELHDLFQLGFQRTCPVNILRERIERLLLSHQA